VGVALGNRKRLEVPIIPEGREEVGFMFTTNEILDGFCVEAGTSIVRLTALREARYLLVVVVVLLKAFS